MSNPDQRTAVARAIWAVMREHEDRCDMELEDNGSDEPIWQYADAALAALSPYEPCYVCGRPMDGFSEDDCHCFHFKQLRSVAPTEAAAMAATVPTIEQVADFLRGALDERTFRTDGDVMVLAERMRHMSRSDRDHMAAYKATLAEYKEKIAAQTPVAGQPTGEDLQLLLDAARSDGYHTAMGEVAARAQALAGQPAEPSPALPQFWKGDRVIYTNEHHVSTPAKVKRVETRWSEDRKPYHYCHIVCDGEKSPRIVPQSYISGAAPKGDSNG